MNDNSITMLYKIVKTKRGKTIGEDISYLSSISRVIANKTIAINTLMIYVDFLQNLIGSAFITPTINPKITTINGITHDAFYLGMNKNSDGVKYDTMMTNNA